MDIGERERRDVGVREEGCRREEDGYRREREGGGM